MARLLLVFLAAALCPALAQEAAKTPSIEVVGTLFRVTMPDSRVLTSPDLIGAILDATDETGRVITVRIDAVTKDDPTNGNGDIWLHQFSTPDPSTGGWREFCTPGPDGTVAGFPVAGTWTADGRHVRVSAGFMITCTSGAIGKCIRIGYKPWVEREGESLWDYHQACVRMLLADYGGDGTGHTRDGTAVEIFDRLWAYSHPSLSQPPVLSSSTRHGDQTVLSAFAGRVFPRCFRPMSWPNVTCT